MIFFSLSNKRVIPKQGGGGPRLWKNSHIFPFFFGRRPLVCYCIYEGKSLQSNEDDDDDNIDGDGEDGEAGLPRQRRKPPPLSQLLCCASLLSLALSVKQEDCIIINVLGEFGRYFEYILCRFYKYYMHTVYVVLFVTSFSIPNILISSHLDHHHHTVK